MKHLENNPKPVKGIARAHPWQMLSQVREYHSTSVFRQVRARAVRHLGRYATKRAGTKAGAKSIHFRVTRCLATLAH